MLYPICPTCGAFLSNIQLPYQRDIRALCEKYNVDLETLSRSISNDAKFNTEKEEIMDKYTDPERYCCRMRLPNFSDLVRIVN
jgi:DNA-directed RNA polymerase subunit N (RpoN/RPB10)